MDSFYDFICHHPPTIRVQVNELLLAEYQCPLDKIRHSIWTHENYFVYVIKGKKEWLTHHEMVEVNEGDCIFVRKGAHSVNQYFDKDFCAVVLFTPDEFIRSVLLHNRVNLNQESHSFSRKSIFSLKSDATLEAYFKTFLTYLSGHTSTNLKLLELKFKELMLITASQPYNRQLTAYFAQLCQNSKPCLQELMERNFYFPMTLEEYARLTARSLSVFKRDFYEIYGTSPGKWLKSKRLEFSKYLLKNTDMSVTEVIFESGFQNPSHFSREFKTAYNCTPLEYKNA
ncbi:helix-turn-helix domain-containing protein [Pararhodonellum marinum]|uniref:helix-turn-helix domain-containing protein n=1 Tax=Pararhodonellum marinum TaxID=2755358 RepID=UPI00188EE807|nr:AraC family transcriptional regulator [Pararhodonellum marinum]